MRISLLAPGVVMSMGMPQRPQGRAAACPTYPRPRLSAAGA